MMQAMKMPSGEIGLRLGGSLHVLDAKEIPALCRALCEAVGLVWPNGTAGSDQNPIKCGAARTVSDTPTEDRDFVAPRVKAVSTLTNCRFAEIAMRIAANASGWASSSITIADHAQRPISLVTVQRFTGEVRELLDYLEERAGLLTDERPADPMEVASIMQELIDEVEANINAEFPEQERQTHTIQQLRYERDMGLPRRARAALAAMKGRV